jgi:hypothetical protein
MNDQCLVMYCEGPDCGAVLEHDDQFRGVSHGYIDHQAGAAFRFVSPDFFRLVPWQGEGLKPVGYGFESIEAIVREALHVNAVALGLSGEAALAARQKMLAETDARGILATPANSFINELVTQAARLSIARDGQPAVIEYEPTPKVRLRA